MPEQQKSCQISVDSGENVSRQSDRQTDRQADGGQLQLQLRLCLISKARQGEVLVERRQGGEWGQSLGNKLTKVVDVLVGLRCLGSTLAMIKCVCLI